MYIYNIKLYIYVYQIEFRRAHGTIGEHVQNVPKTPLRLAGCIDHLPFWPLSRFSGAAAQGCVLSRPQDLCHLMSLYKDRQKMTRKSVRNLPHFELMVKN